MNLVKAALDVAGPGYFGVMGAMLIVFGLVAVAVVGALVLVFVLIVKSFKKKKAKKALEENK